MTQTSHRLQEDEQSIQVMIGCRDMLLWGSLSLKKHVHVAAFLITLAEDFVLLYDVKILFLAPRQQTPPIERQSVFIKLEEILFLMPLSLELPLPEEDQTRKHLPVEAIVGSFTAQGTIIKAPAASLKNMLLVSRDDYLSIYQATLRHIAKPWLGTFTGNLLQVRRDSLTLIAQ